MKCPNPKCVDGWISSDMEHYDGKRMMVKYPDQRCMLCNGTGEIKGQGLQTPDHNNLQSYVTTNKKEAGMPIGMKECVCQGKDKDCQWCKGSGQVGVNCKFKLKSGKTKKEISGDEGDKREEETLRMDGGTDEIHPMRAIIVMISGSAGDIGTAIRELTRE